MTERTPSSVAAVFIGDVAMDEYFHAEVWPSPGDKGTITTEALYVGGSIANAARVYARLGGAPEFVSLLKPGAFSDGLLRSLTQSGIGTAHMIYDPEVGDQRNFIFLVDGEHVVLTPDVDERPMHFRPDSLGELAGAGYLYTTLMRARRLRTPEYAGAEVVAALRAGGRKVVYDLDVDGFTADDAEYLRGAEVILMNEVGFTASFPTGRPEEVEAFLRENDIATIVHSRAEHGIVAYTGTDRFSVPGYRVPVVDVTGAGDTLGGSLVFALGSGMPLRDALEFAVAAASRSVMFLGPGGGATTADQVVEFARSFERGAHTHADRG